MKKLLIAVGVGILLSSTSALTATTLWPGDTKISIHVPWDGRYKVTFGGKLTGKELDVVAKNRVQKNKLIFFISFFFEAGTKKRPQ